jgi:peptide chain release factor subunit 1
LKGDYLHYELNNMLLNTVDTQTAGEGALREVLNKSAELLQSMCAPEEQRVVRKLMAELARQDGLATYGFDTVVNALRKGEVKVAIVTDSAQAAGVPAEKDIVDFLEDLASQTDAAIEVIFSSSPEKEALTALGGVAALLRFKPK